MHDPDERPAPTLSLLRVRRDEILRVAALRGVSNSRAFGPVVRGDATSDSDIDLLVDVERGHRGLDLCAFAREVEALIGSPVDVGTGIEEAVRERIASQLVAL